MADYLSLVAAANAAAYDRYLGPPQFEPYARDLAGRLGAMTDGDLLETAAGTGVLTRVLARTLPEAVRIIATDLNPARLDYAAAQPGAARVSWQQADALALPFENASFDAVVCQFGVMFFSGQDRRVSRSIAGPATRRPLSVQRLGSHRGERTQCGV